MKGSKLGEEFEVKGGGGFKGYAKIRSLDGV